MNGIPIGGMVAVGNGGGVAFGSAGAGPNGGFGFGAGLGGNGGFGGNGRMMIVNGGFNGGRNMGGRKMGKTIMIDLFGFITKTCLCNIQRFLAEKMKISSENI